MRPVSVRFKCFGPYMDEQFVDFSLLEKSGLFLICGETGAGKTSILDAMCYALYGRSSGGLRGDMSVMRCKLAGKNDETLVEFVFDVGGKRYKFVRSLKYGRKNLNDTHNCLVREGDVFVPIFENPKATFVNQKAQELIGLTYDQFRQVIILPQGQFEKLLVSDSVEKEKILVSLFHADRWQRISEELYRRVTEQDNALKQERLQISAKLREYGCDRLPELETLIGQTREAAAALQTQAAEAKAQAAHCKQVYGAALVENEAFVELDRREKRLGSLLPRVSEFDREEGLLALAEEAQRLKPGYTAYRDAKAGAQRAKGVLNQREQALIRAEQAHKTAETARAAHEAARGDYERDRYRLTVLESAGELYRSLDEKKATADRQTRAEERARKTLDAAALDFESKDRTWQQAMAAQKQAMEAYQQAQAGYLRSVGGILAGKLVAGEPCPVCGSREHPAPAAAAGAVVTDAQLEAFNQAMNRAGEAVTAAFRAWNRAEAQRTQAETAYHQTAQAAAVARGDYEGALQRRIEEIDTLAQLEAQRKRLGQRIAAFEAAEARTSQAVQEAATNEKVAQAGLENAREEWTAAQTQYTAQAAAWQQALAESTLENESRFLASDLEPEERQQRQTALIRFRTELAGARNALEEQKQRLAGREAPDVAGCKAAMDAAEEAERTAISGLALQNKRLETMERDAAALERRSRQVEEARIRVDGDLEFANRLRGRSGISLQRYVLGVMLTSVTREANRLLKNVYGGRYQLHRTDEIAGSGRKGGLELEVYDASHNQRRSVTTLSGGEKFLVALSLAIGLSTVVQAQGSGIRLEAMFIDEGFGSLDRDSVADALEVLQGIRRGAGVVGIISHVEQLAETIPTKIEITKGKNGSQCILRC